MLTCITNSFALAASTSASDRPLLPGVWVTGTALSVFKFARSAAPSATLASSNFAPKIVPYRSEKGVEKRSERRIEEDVVCSKR